MTNKLQELKNDATKSEIKVSELLRRAKIVVGESDKEFLVWIEKELNGYGKDKKVPAYRMIHGEPKGWNPYRGWIPFVISNPESQELISTRGSSQSVAELESLASNKSSSYLEMPYPAKNQADFSKSVGMDTKFSLLISSSAIDGILNAVRNKLIDWLIAIDTNDTTNEPIVGVEDIIFPEELIVKLPQDVKLLVDDFNFNFAHNRPKTCLLILRRVLPLSIVRRYQQDDKEAEIKGSGGDYLDTKALLGKSENLLSQKRIYTDLVAYKILTDGAQHSYTLNVQISDAKGAAIATRVFLDDIFKDL